MLNLSKYWPESQEEVSERTKVLMSPISACDLCGALLAPSAGGRTNHMKTYHGVNSVGGYRPMDPKIKEETIKKVEDRLAAFLIKTDEAVSSIPVQAFKQLPAIFPIHTKKYTCNDCGPCDNAGVTRYDGCFLCFSCLEKRASLPSRGESL